MLNLKIIQNEADNWDLGSAANMAYSASNFPFSWLMDLTVAPLPYVIIVLIAEIKCHYVFT